MLLGKPNKDAFSPCHNLFLEFDNAEFSLPTEQLVVAWLPVALTTMARLLGCQASSNCLCFRFS